MWEHLLCATPSKWNCYLTNMENGLSVVRGSWQWFFRRPRRTKSEIDERANSSVIEFARIYSNNNVNKEENDIDRLFFFFFFRCESCIRWANTRFSWQLHPTSQNKKQKNKRKKPKVIFHLVEYAYFLARAFHTYQHFVLTCLEFG